MELIIFVAFVGVQATAHCLPKMCARFNHLWIVQHIANKHWVVWLFHPVILHGIHDYALHFVIYSGYVIRSH